MAKGMHGRFKDAAPYISDPKKVVVRGWVQVDGYWFSIEPVWDPVEKLWAKLTYLGALEAARRWKGELVNLKDVDRLHEDAAKGLALELPVFALPDKYWLKKGGVPSDPKADPKAREQEINDYRDANMGGLSWAQYHDHKLVQPKLDDAGWKPEGTKRLANCGKHWTAGAPKGGGTLKGWWNKDTKKFWQTGGGVPHDDKHHDYATTTIIKVKSDDKPPSDPNKKT